MDLRPTVKDIDENLIRQRDEMFVLENVYTKDEFRICISEPPFSGILKVPVSLPCDNFTINYRIKSKILNRTVKYVPPIEFYFQLPNSYPSHNMPKFMLHCVWLTDDHMKLVDEKLNLIWNEHKGTEILYTWAIFINCELFEYLNLSKGVFITIKNDEEIVENYTGSKMSKLKISDKGEENNSGVVFQNNEMRYKKYVKENKTGMIAKNQNNSKKSSGTVECVKINNTVKYIFSGNSNQTFKYETEKEAAQRLNSQVFADVGPQKYVVNPDNVCPEDEHLIEEEKTVNSKLITESLLVQEEDMFKIFSETKFISGETTKSDRLAVIEKYNLLKFEKDIHLCQVCYSSKQGSSCDIIYPCCHVFCKECMNSYIEVCIFENSVNQIKCMAHECESKITDSNIKNILTDELYQRYKKLKLQYILSTNKSLIYCPREICQNIAFSCDINGDLAGHCRQCEYYFCVFCKKAYHGKQGCDLRTAERVAVIEQYQNGSEEEKRFLEKRYSKKQLQKWVDEKLSESWKDEKTKKCSNCSAVIEKYDGCNKVKCVKCNTSFCWICGQTLISIDPYGHFLNEKSPCYKLLFFGETGVNNDENFDDDGVDFSDEEEDIDWDWYEEIDE